MITPVRTSPKFLLNGSRKALAVHFAHTSHGSQIITGLLKLEEVLPVYGVAVEDSTGPVALPSETGALRIYDGNNYPGDTYITPEMYWETPEGTDKTRSVANTGWFNYSTWAWCGQASYYSASQIQTYLDTLNQLETEYPAPAVYLHDRSHRRHGQ